MDDTFNKWCVETDSHLEKSFQKRQWLWTPVDAKHAKRNNRVFSFDSNIVLKWCLHLAIGQSNYCFDK